MPKPEGYRKAMRIMELAERFDLPIITFIDTINVISKNTNNFNCNW